MNEFELEGKEWVELKNLLQLVGFCETGGMSKMAIVEGLVKVDDVIEFRKGRKIRSGQIVEFEGHKIIVR